MEKTKAKAVFMSFTCRPWHMHATFTHQNTKIKNSKALKMYFLLCVGVFHLPVPIVPIFSYMEEDAQRVYKYLSRIARH